MNFTPFNWGDWATATKWLTHAEKGLYIDLLELYYTSEQPIMHEQCKRIANALQMDMQKSLQFVLDTFFEDDGTAYHHNRCDREIAKYRNTAEGRRLAANRRWNKDLAKSSKANASDEDMQTGCNCNANGYANADANALQLDAICNAKQETRNKKQEDRGAPAETPQEPAPAFSLEAADAAPCQPKSSKPSSKKVTMPYSELPGAWADVCARVRPDLRPAEVFASFKFYWTSGNGAGEKKTERGWAQTWGNWIKNEKATAAIKQPEAEIKTYKTKKYTPEEVKRMAEEQRQRGIEFRRMNELAAKEWAELKAKNGGKGLLETVRESINILGKQEEKKDVAK